MIFQLKKNDHAFPDPSLAEPDGLLAIGGDLDADRLIKAYHLGIFPWYAEDDPICWYSPHKRCVLFPDEINISRSMAKIIRQNKFEIRMDTAFTEVIRKCKSIGRKGMNGTWITNEMEEAYILLHQKGIAHSIEAWCDNKLAGGMYGLDINGVFCGESMFSEVANSSKAVMIWICTFGKYRLLDCQLPNDHLLSMGAQMISRESYLNILNQ